MIAQVATMARDRERAVLIIAAGVALAAGVFAASASDVWIVSIAALAVLAVVALLLPLTTLGWIIVLVIPVQIYLALPALATQRVVVILTAVAALRIALQAESIRSLWQNWMMPVVVFIAAALIAAWGAQDRYTALRGVYDFAVIFLTAWVFSHLARDQSLVKRMVIALIAVGVAQAAYGLYQVALGREGVFQLLQAPFNDFLYPPHPLREQLAVQSFNWLVDNGVAPFGTFLNGIDFAIFMATLLCLIVPFLLTSRKPLDTVALLAIALLFFAALLLTQKGTGMLALLGGGLVLAWYFLPRFSPRALALGVLLAIGALALLLLSSASLAERALFLLQREQGAFGTSGRLDIWLSLVADFIARPFFGYGLNNSIYLTEPARAIRRAIVIYNLTAPESQYVAALVETGIVGLGALGAWLVVAVRRGVARVRETRAAWSVGILAAIIALLFGNLTLVAFTTDALGMLLGVLIGMEFAEWRKV